jgi:dTDP-4-amino-4,6-dideoxygalactose transaminase
LPKVSAFLKQGRFILGPEVEKFESQIAKIARQKYACGVGAGTDALYLALRALGVGKGDEVITTSLSWVATANAIVMNGATPVFADINDDLNICPESVASLINRKTRAIVPVHFTGYMCDILHLHKICKKHGIYLVEDCAQAICAERDGYRAGELSDCAAFSMNCMKVLSAVGEAGCVCTSNLKIKNKLDALRYNGCYDRQIATHYSLNFRLDAIQALILNRKIKKLSEVIKIRKRIANYYRKNLQTTLQVPKPKQPRSHIFYTYTVLTKNRDDIQKKLKKHGIETKIQHKRPLFKNPAFSSFHKKAYDLYKVNKITNRILCLPIYEKMKTSEIEQIVKHIKNS